MARVFVLLVIFILLGYGFWLNSDFKLIAAGVAIFLFGMLSLEDGLKSFSGSTLQTILQRSTDRIYKSIAFGVVTTSIVQSSSLISILTISFLSAGLISLAGAIGIVFGANLGTTTGAWLVAGLGLKVDIAAYAMPMFVFGVILILQKSLWLKGIGHILAGLGFLFLGIAYMKEGFEAFKATLDIAQYSVGGVKGLLIYTLIGVGATVIMQSSHATLVLIITALSAQQISYENALALAIGANIGTTISALIASISSSIEGKRLAVAHLIFNGITALIALVLIKQFMQVVDYISIDLGIANDDYTLKLALFHTLFNLVGVVVLLPFINALVRLLEKLISQKSKLNRTSIDSVRYLNNAVLELPHTAMVALVKESKHLYENGFRIIAKGLNLKRRYIVSSMELDEMIELEHYNEAIDINDLYQRRIKGIYGDIIDFATKAQVKISADKIDAIYKLKLANRDMVEAIKNTQHLQKNLLKYTQSQNIYIKEQYDAIRKNLALLLRNINIIASTNEEDIILLLLSKSKTQVEQYDIIADGVLDNLIRKGLITNEMTTSLMNDSSYAYNIAKSLINMSEILFVQMKNIDL
ncbi:MAG: Na/Pi cotransporter family protein [Campylobacterales bacterium]|nr:Na/Pi cotransporter family protein [Campylobacterales bacterium]